MNQTKSDEVEIAKTDASDKEKDKKKESKQEEKVVESKLEEKKEQESKEQLSKAAEAFKSSAVAAQGQLLGVTAKQADAAPSLDSLSAVVGQYNYESYRVIMLSGEVLGLKELGYTAATLDIDAQGTLTRRMTGTNGKVDIQTAKIVEVKLGSNSGYWIAQWPGIRYPVQADISFNASRLISRMQFEDMGDTARFGSVEQAMLRRVGSK